jgi:hypothetical protein
MVSSANSKFSAFANRGFSPAKSCFRYQARQYQTLWSTRYLRYHSAVLFLDDSLWPENQAFSAEIVSLQFPCQDD